MPTATLTLEIQPRKAEAILKKLREWKEELGEENFSFSYEMGITKIHVGIKTDSLAELDLQKATVEALEGVEKTETHLHINFYSL